jgi:hypothetical protein
MTYYERPDDSVNEQRILEKAKQLFPFLSKFNFEYRPDGITGAIYDARSIDTDDKIHIDIKILYDKRNYKKNIISTEKYDYMVARPDRRFFFLAYYPNQNKMRLRQIHQQTCEYEPNFTWRHKRESERQGKDVYKSDSIYYLVGRYEDRFVEKFIENL